MPDHQRRSGAASATSRAVATAGVGLVLAALPVFLVGGLAVQLRADLGLGEAGLGAVVSAAFLVGAVASPVAGRVADRLGPTRSILVGAGWATASAAGIALVATSWAGLAATLALAGLGFAFMDPGLALLVQARVPHDRQGFALGTKEAAVPASTLLAGLAVPAMALTVGWRWAFALVVPVLAVLLGLLAAERRAAGPSSPASRGGGAGSGPAGGPPGRDATTVAPGPRAGVDVRLLAVAAALGSAAASGVGVFLTDTAVARGLTPASAGLVLALGSVVGIVTRLGVGIRADRRPGSSLPTMGTMLAIGAVAMAIGSLDGTAALVVGTVGTFGAGWGWSGLLFLGLLRLRPDAAGSATGVGLAGLATGNALGPLGFGVLAQTTSPQAAWLAAALAAGIGAGLVAWTTRGLRGRTAP